MPRKVKLSPRSQSRNARASPLSLLRRAGAYSASSETAVSRAASIAGQSCTAAWTWPSTEPSRSMRAFAAASVWRGRWIWIWLMRSDGSPCLRGSCSSAGASLRTSRIGWMARKRSRTVEVTSAMTESKMKGMLRSVMARIETGSPSTAMPSLVRTVTRADLRSQPWSSSLAWMAARASISGVYRARSSLLARSKSACGSRKGWPIRPAVCSTCEILLLRFGSLPAAMIACLPPAIGRMLTEELHHATDF